MVDLVKRLRDAGDDYTVAWGSGELYDEAADELERLTRELEEAQKDAERLNWMSSNEAWVGWNREGDLCRVWRRSEDPEDYRPEPVCGWPTFFDDARAAIDTAMSQEK